VDERGTLPEPGADLEYDLAHEAGQQARVAGTTAGPEHEQPREAVINATPTYDGDYSYDLAHDIPKG
jgi:hypothetical protein